MEAVTGRNVLRYIDEKNDLITETAQALKANNVSDLPARAAQVVAEQKAAEKEVEKLNAQMAAASAKEMLGNATDLGAVKLIVSKVENVQGGELRNLADSAKEQGDDIVAVLAAVNGAKVNFACACGKAAVRAGAHAGNIVREVAKIAGGNGGGRPDSAMAGGKDASKVDDALNAAADIVTGMLK